jgi:hypothetical protein
MRFCHQKAAGAGQGGLVVSVFAQQPKKKELPLELWVSALLFLLSLLFALAYGNPAYAAEGEDGIPGDTLLSSWMPGAFGILFLFDAANFAENRQSPKLRGRLSSAIGLAELLCAAAGAGLYWFYRNGWEDESLTLRLAPTLLFVGLPLLSFLSREASRNGQGLAPAPHLSQTFFFLIGFGAILLASFFPLALYASLLPDSDLEARVLAYWLMGVCLIFFALAFFALGVRKDLSHPLAVAGLIGSAAVAILALAAVFASLSAYENGDIGYQLIYWSEASFLVSFIIALPMGAYAWRLIQKRA